MFGIRLFNLRHRIAISPSTRNLIRTHLLRCTLEFCTPTAFESAGRSRKSGLKTNLTHTSAATAQGPQSRVPHAGLQAGGAALRARPLGSGNQQPGGARSAAVQDPAEDFRLLPKRGRRGGPGEPEDDAGDGAHAGLERIGDAGGRPGGGFDQAEDAVAGRLRLHAPEFRPKDADRSRDGRISTCKSKSHRKKMEIGT